jgi:hypothetical protein
MKEVEEEVNSRFGTSHPFGGETYAEQVAKRAKSVPSPVAQVTKGGAIGHKR